MADIDLLNRSQLPSPKTANSITALPFSVSLTAAHVGSTGTIRIGVMPAGFVSTSVAMVVTDLDSGGSPALVFDIGTETDDDCFIAGSTAGQAGGVDVAIENAGVLLTYTTDQDILMTVDTAAATGAAGTLQVTLIGYYA